MGDTQKLTLVQSFIASLPCASIIPSMFIVLYLFNVILLSTLKFSIVIFYFSFIVLPLIYKNVYFFQRNVIFLNFVNIPANPNYSNPAEYGLEGVQNFYLKTNDNITLGVWQILPEDLLSGGRNKDENYYKNALKNGRSVVIYNHGNAGHRAAAHRVQLYKLLRRHFHVITYDYRGYGDSSNSEPTEMGLVNDSRCIYEWVRNNTLSDIFVWGHSLGSSISARTLSLLAIENIRPTGLFLESPFNNMHDEIVEHPYARPFRYLPWFFYTIIEPMQENKLQFKTDQHIKNVDCPIIILHSKDDTVVPYHLGSRLFHEAQENRLKCQGKVFFYSFEAQFCFGHNFICRSSELDSIISNFVSYCMEEKQLSRQNLINKL